MRDVLCVGNAVADTIVRPVTKLPPGGRLVYMDEVGLHGGVCALFSARAAARLGLKAGIVAGVGRDAFGAFLVKRLEEEGVETFAVVRDPRRQSSATAVLVYPGGERSFLHTPGASAAVGERSVPDALLKRHRALHLSGFFIMPRLDGPPARRVLARAKRLGLLTTLDSCWDPRKRWHLILPCLPHVDYYVPSWEEAREVFQTSDLRAIAWAALRRGVRRAVVLKMGARGCYALTREGREHRVPAFRVRAVDATGAGDCFDAGLLTGLLRGWPLRRSLQLGCAAGALSVSASGGLGLLRSFSQASRLARS